MSITGRDKPPLYSELVSLMPGLEKELDVLIVPTLGVPMRPHPLDYVFPHLKKVFDGHRDIIRRHADQVREFIFSPHLDTVPQTKTDDVTPYWGNDYFHPGDARLAYAVIACHRPRRVIEIGCGNSTKFMRRAIDDYQLPTRITCIDPQPREDISKVAHEYFEASLPTVDLDVFDQLEPGDVLFLDGSHLVMNGSDCVQFFLNILPRLPKGVWIHLHDIFLPFDYPYQLFLDCKSNEQYMLAMLFLFSREWLPVLPIYYGYREGILPHGGGSLWMKRQ
ncbi:MAG TPA: class I SAM-dependent methyltransferase [Verrucomicrobiae bacterium]|nr:class I SAM-dependent methyltransferase [Verrucomicrobiae bacterium]